MSELVNTVLLVEVFVTLFVIMDPVGTVPIFLSLTGGRSAASARRAAWQAVAVSFLVISLFAFFGQQILGYLHISLPALQGAGGLLLLLVALELLTDNEKEPTASAGTNVALVPLGTPLLAGPGAIVAVMLFVESVDDVADFVAVVARGGPGARQPVAGDALLAADPAADPRVGRAAGDPDRRPAALGDRGAAGGRLGARLHRRRGLSLTGAPSTGSAAARRAGTTDVSARIALYWAPGTENTRPRS